MIAGIGFKISTRDSIEVTEVNKVFRGKTRKQSARSVAKTFINKYAELDDLEELKQLISERESILKG